MAINAFSLFGRVSVAGAEDSSRKIGGVSRAVDTAQGRFRTLGSGASKLGVGLARVGTLAAAAATGGILATAKAAIEYEDAFAGVRKTADLTEGEFGQLSSAIRRMATEIPISATELAGVAETAGALGIEGVDNIREFTRVVSLLGVTTDLTSATAAEAMGKLGTILGLTGEEYERFGSALVNLGNKGASTESEIIEVSKRFAAAGQQAGLAEHQILAYASAISSLGIEPEAAGSSLSRLFNNLSKETAVGSDKAKAWAEAIGLSFKDFQKLALEDPNQAVTELLQTLSKLDRHEQARLLKDIGITNVRDLNAVQLLSAGYQTLAKSFVDGEEGWEKNNALAEEARKKFETVGSRLTLLKNTVVDAGISFAEGFTPAVGRAADKLAAWLKGGGANELKNVGRDMGAFIDRIDWKKAIDGGKQVLGVVRDVVDLVKSLPTEVQIAGLALLGLNKATGGLVTDLAGGLAGAATDTAGSLLRGAASRLPVVGAAFATPVRVVNWHEARLAGGMGGVPPVSGAGGASGAGRLLGGAFMVVSAAAIANEIEPAISGFGAHLNRAMTGPGSPLEGWDREVASKIRAWRAEAPWPFGSKGAPEWAYMGPGSGAPPAPTLPPGGRDDYGHRHGAQQPPRPAGRESDYGTRNPAAIDSRLAEIRNQIRTSAPGPKIDAMRAAVVTAAGNVGTAVQRGDADVRRGIDLTTSTLKAKKLSPVINVAPSHVSVRVNGREIASAITNYLPRARPV